MIENSDRGITLNKGLAWTIFSAVLVGGIWIGVQVTTAKNGINILTERQSEDREAIQMNTRAINDLRRGEARMDQRLTNIERGIEQTRRDVSEILRYLRTDQP